MRPKGHARCYREGNSDRKDTELTPVDEAPVRVNYGVDILNGGQKFWFEKWNISAWGDAESGSVMTAPSCELPLR